MIALSPGADLFPLAAAVLSAITCAALGNFLVLRRLSLMGDAISHSVLPGLVIAFLIASTRSPIVMFAGAAIAGVATVVLVELVKRLGRVEPGAAMGVVFSILFALGVLLIEQAAVRHVDLDAECVLHGQLETLWWPGAPASFAGVLHADTLAAVPRQVWTLLITALGSLAFVTLLFKELRLAAFDPALSTAQGFHAGVLHYALMILVAAATVASFEAVGSILVIAMLIAPAATARLLTDRLRAQILVSLVLAVVGAVAGYLAATLLPAAIGLDAVNIAGSIAVTLGVILTASVFLAPRHGVISRRLHHRALARRVALDDLLATLYRVRESGSPEPQSAALNPRALRLAADRGLISLQGPAPRLTDAGLETGRELVRRHRLWERYLVDRAGFSPDHVHDPAELLEHVPLEPPATARTDPHGRTIPDHPPRSDS